MTAQTGRTHSKWLTVLLDNNSGTLTDLSAYVNTVGQFGKTYDTQDVTAFSDGVKNIVIGHPAAPLTIGGPIDTVVITHFSAINGVGTPLSQDFRIGIRHAWEAGEPQFGITSSSTVGYICFDFKVDPVANTWAAQLDVFGPTSPEFGTAAEV
jgi:hypothetical protein